MGENTKISWADHTFNPWWGCTRVGGSPACDPGPDHDGPVCYAESFSKRCGYGPDPVDASKFPIWGADAQRRFFGDKHWREPLRWNQAAEEAQMSARAFCMSMGDWAEGRPDQAPSLVRLWDLIRRTTSIDWLMLTKRPQLITKICPLWNNSRVWQGTTAENQPWLDLRWEHLKRVHAIVYWLSIEPMVGPIDLPPDFLALGKRAWVICGGGSGGQTMPFSADWARSLRDQCGAAGVPFHMKQMSGRTPKQLQAIPEDLMIREYPEARRNERQTA